MMYIEIKNNDNYAIDYSERYIIIMQLKYMIHLEQVMTKELYLSTRKGLKINGFDTKPYMSIIEGGTTLITPKDSQCSVSSLTLMLL